MKQRFSNQRNQAMTLVEVLVVIVVLFVLVVFIRQADLMKKAPRINCLNNLHEIGLSYRSWAKDNGGKFPMEISTTNGGTKEFVADGKNAWLNYLVMSNILNTPKILICPADADRLPPATSFSTELVGKISYFVGLNASTNFPQAIISGDDNLEISGVPVKSGLLELSMTTPISWTTVRHINGGNIGLADGSAQEISTNGLRQALQQTGLATNRLAIP
jgi:prepilin-type processing-associated H-X9-DG protein